MNVDGHHLQVLICLQGFDGGDDAIQLCRIAAIISTQFYPVDREVDIGTLIQMANLRSGSNNSLQLENRFQDFLLRLLNGLDNLRRIFTLLLHLAWN